MIDRKHSQKLKTEDGDGLKNEFRPHTNGLTVHIDREDGEASWKKTV